MQPYQQRVLDEKRELDSKRSRLLLFLGSPSFATVSPDEALRLGRQADIMAQYSIVLAERIAAFPP